VKLVFALARNLFCLPLEFRHITKCGECSRHQYCSYLLRSNIPNN
jgi:hypothetical protein